MFIHLVHQTLYCSIILLNCIAFGLWFSWFMETTVSTIPGILMYVRTNGLFNFVYVTCIFLYFDLFLVANGLCSECSFKSQNTAIFDLRTNSTMLWYCCIWKNIHFTTMNYLLFFLTILIFFLTQIFIYLCIINSQVFPTSYWFLDIRLRSIK